jgi:hypothetical protein
VKVQPAAAAVRPLPLFQPQPPSAMNSLVYRPSPQPPLSRGDLERYADGWVVVRAGKVVVAAMTFDEIAPKRKAAGFRDGDRILRLPPATQR